MKTKFSNLTLVTHKQSTPINNYLAFIEQCIMGGVNSVQLREKQLSYSKLKQFGQLLKQLLDCHNVPLIINDNVVLCCEIDANGVHIGQSDGDPWQTRSLLGDEKIIGLSVNSIDQIKRANRSPVNYIALSAIFNTPNKSNVETLWGVAGIKQAALLSTHPIVAIGGINNHNALAVLSADAQGIAAIGAFHNARDPFLAARDLKNKLKRHAV